VSQYVLEFTLNGAQKKLSVPANRLLIDLLRDDCNLMGTKEGCGIGVCGSCSVLIDGKLMSSCLVLATSIDGAKVETIEGIAGSVIGATVGDAFIRRGGFQCGICTSGQVVAASALLERSPAPSADDVRSWMMGNLCRCTGYYQIVEAVLEAAKER
jgi:aerobic carbon-monoxide dehydrogenase small subunit